MSRESANNRRTSYIRTRVAAYTRARMWTITLYNKEMEERASRSSVVLHKIGCENRRPPQYCRVSENDQKAQISKNSEPLQSTSWREIWPVLTERDLFNQVENTMPCEVRKCLKL